MKKAKNTERTTVLTQQLDFFRAVDRMKTVYRRAWLVDQSRTENDAEHSWHVSILAMLFSDLMEAKNLDQLKVLQMLLIHDLVEIEAGDTYPFDDEGNKTKKERELRAAAHLFGILPNEQGAQWQSLWLEFDNQSSPEARFASLLDKVHPFLQNYFSDGKAWRIHQPDPNRVLARLEPLRQEFPELFDVVENIMAEAINKGYLKKPYNNTPMK